MKYLNLKGIGLFFSYFYEVGNKPKTFYPANICRQFYRINIQNYFKCSILIYILCDNYLLNEMSSAFLSIPEIFDTE